MDVILTIFTMIGGVVFAIIGFFLKQTMSTLKEVKDVAYKNKLDISVMKSDSHNKFNYMTEKFDSLNDSVKELTIEIKELNKRIK
jgi:hypothetical protein